MMSSFCISAGAVDFLVSTVTSTTTDTEPSPFGAGACPMHSSVRRTEAKTVEAIRQINHFIGSEGNSNWQSFVLLDSIADMLFSASPGSVAPALGLQCLAVQLLGYRRLPGNL